MKKKNNAIKPPYGFGWIPDIPDQRDYVHHTPKAVFVKLPAKIDLRKKCPPVYQQDCLGSCTANAIAAAIQFVQKKNKSKNNFMPSRLFIYYNERVMEKTVNIDNGAQIRNGIKSVAKQGVCPEKMWPYKIGSCKILGRDNNGDDIYDIGAVFKKKPPKKCYTEALKFQVLQYERVNNTVQQLKGCLAEGFPIVFGFTVYNSFYNVMSNGIMPLPDKKEKSIGGHAVLCVGYNDARQHFIIRNSYGKEWGNKGHFYMPYSFMTSDNCDDFWVIKILEE